MSALTTKIVQYVQEAFQLKAVGRDGETTTNCPFCRDDKEHMYVNVEKMLFNCFRCGEKGNLIQFISKSENITTAEVYRKLRIKRYIVPSPLDERPTDLREVIKSFNKPAEVSVDKRFESFDYPYYFRFLIDNKMEEAVPYRNYLYGRNLTDSDITLYGIGYCNRGKFRNRVILPVFMDKKLVGYQGRDITGFNKPKILNPFGFNKSKCLFNYDFACQYDHVCVVEGPFDAIHVGLNAVATFGKLISDEQIELLEPFNKITLILDYDARNEALATAAKFQNHNVSVLLLPNGEPDSYSREDLYKMIETQTISAHSVQAFGAKMQIIMEKM